MAASTQSRKSEQSAAQGSTRTQGIDTPREASLSARLWTASGNSERLPSLWENESPAACLILDLMAASDAGVQASRQGEVLTASFSTFQSAVFTARRLQWAMQGFSEADHLQATSLAILVHSPDEEHGETIAEDALHSLEQAAAGEILLTEKASQHFDRLPGFPLQVASGDGLWELVWRAPESRSARSFDEQMLAQLVEQQGGQAHPPQPPEPPPAAQADYAAEAAERNLRQLDSEPAHGKSRGMMVVLAVAALLVVGVGIYYFSQGKSTSDTAADQTQPPAQSLSGPNPAVAQGGAALPPGSSAQQHNVAPATAKTPHNPTGVTVKPPPTPEPPRPVKPVEPPPARSGGNGRCDLEPSQYSGLVDQAWKNLGRGKYNDAKRQFGAVLACEPGNASAKTGMERARNAAVAADGGSQN
jgi:hypothetical protein